ncbi:hypothetical protein L917_20250 [Phytophthora nicotianae]|uniref:PX domain-containing protein n=5 Tax=Phytophthora nicotianae TaxID=4792 RepID=W2PG54_PHYN3|nr:hypothetical protein PPTG_18399 [Phytophthora nicotianae INRA-310]ETI32016.1 hypothetical protein F443_21109 [Phytophthora nicotianae P1569]ETL25850.1 hypothetical protein L916_20366 [Phytophthora nicotianae]ETO60754.1 hypothetical protein F444_21112 [Phytophthora nicotianae P1976]ETL79051.1 hypothetical protein L917_20250 [Phytophthora nicotianae]ETM30703.1 hypothetical protein L914_21622 [Phytophthora nicotianae]
MSILHQSSSDVVVGGLARLSPMRLLPERYSRHMQTVNKLKQIRSVLVSAANGNYAIDVYTPSQSRSRIPTSFKTKAQHLDAHIEKHFSDFVALRDELYETCKTSHPTMSCPFCTEVAGILLLGAALPGPVLSLVLSQRQRTKAVQRFVENLLQLAASCPVIDFNACPCQEQLPRELFMFLFGESDPLT